MSEATYNQVISEIKTLNFSDQLRLLEEMDKGGILGCHFNGNLTGVAGVSITQQ